MIYCFSRPNQMVGHRFTDDVAIVRAISKKAAVKKLSKYYKDILECEVNRIPFSIKVKILTDY
jgi:hypothetical protein